MLSGAKRCARKAFALLIVLCLFVSVPAFAHKVTPVSGVINLEPDSFGFRGSSSATHTVWCFDDVPASFQFSDSNYVFGWNSASAYGGYYSIVTAPNIEYSVQVVVGDGVGDCFVSFDSFIAKPYFRAVTSDSLHGKLLDFRFTGVLEMYVDGILVYEKALNNSTIPLIPAWEGFVSRYFELRVVTSSLSEFVVDSSDATIIKPYFGVSVSGLTVDDGSVAIQDISVSIKNIEQDIGDIKDGVSSIENTVTNIGEGVAKIDGTVTDMSEQLQSPDSNIWQAGATTIKNAVTELFVPPQEELASMSEQAQLILMDKLGEPAYLVNEGVAGGGRIIGAFTGGGRTDGIEFPGITVSLPNIGVYEIIPAQTVVIENRYVSILQDAFGLIVGLLCSASVIHLVEDFFICILSGVSYWGFIRSKHL